MGRTSLGRNSVRRTRRVIVQPQDNVSADVRAGLISSRTNRERHRHYVQSSPGTCGATATALANREDADLFISLHVNASPNIDARGIETYYLDNTTDEAAIRLAARENATSRKNISDLQFILSDMMQNMKLEDSITLAHRLQTSLVSGMSKFMGEVKDLGVKKALFHVLVGARMPSILVEMFFITNQTESRVMVDASYQEAMVNALFEGIQKYAQSNLMAKTL